MSLPVPGGPLTSEEKVLGETEQHVTMISEEFGDATKYFVFYRQCVQKMWLE